MNENLKIVLFISISFILSFSILFVYLSVFESGILNKNSETNSILRDIKNFDADLQNKDIVVIIGNSQIRGLNATLFQKLINSNENQINVLHNAIGGSHPSTRIKLLNDLLDLKPELVLYSVSWTSLSYTIDLPEELSCYSGALSQNHNVDSFNILYTIMSDFTNLPSPKHVTFELLKKAFNVNTKEYVPYKNTDTSFTLSTLYVSNPVSTYDPSINVYSSHCDKAISEANYLREIIFRLQQNNIEIVLFSPPFSDDYFQKISKLDEEKFFFILESISDEFNVDFYNLTHEISDKSAFRLVDHVHETNKPAIYAELLSEHVLSKNSTNFLTKYRP